MFQLCESVAANTLQHRRNPLQNRYPGTGIASRKAPMFQWVVEKVEVGTSLLYSSQMQ